MNGTRIYAFPKSSRLSAKKEIEWLFRQGSSFSCGPFRIIYHIQSLQEGAPCKILISVPKRNHKRAVRRNLLKRRIREAFRLHYNHLLEPTLAGSQIKLTFLCLYLPSEILTYGQLEPKMCHVLERLADLLKTCPIATLSTAD